MNATLLRSAGVRAGARAVSPRAARIALIVNDGGVAAISGCTLVYFDKYPRGFAVLNQRWDTTSCPGNDNRYHLSATSPINNVNGAPVN